MGMLIWIWIWNLNWIDYIRLQMWNLHLTTTGGVVPSDAEDMLEPCVSISALQGWRGLDDTPDSSSSSAAAVDYDDYNGRRRRARSNRNGPIETIARIPGRTSALRRGILLRSMYPRGFLSYVTPGSRCRLQSIPLSVLAAHAGCGWPLICT